MTSLIFLAQEGKDSQVRLSAADKSRCRNPIESQCFRHTGDRTVGHNKSLRIKYIWKKVEVSCTEPCKGLFSPRRMEAGWVPESKSLPFRMLGRRCVSPTHMFTDYDDITYGWLVSSMDRNSSQVESVPLTDTQRFLRLPPLIHKVSTSTSSSLLKLSLSILQECSLLPSSIIPGSHSHPSSRHQTIWQWVWHLRGWGRWSGPIMAQDLCAVPVVG